MRSISVLALAVAALLAIPHGAFAAPVSEFHDTFTVYLEPAGCQDEGIIMTEDWHSVAKSDTTPSGVVHFLQVSRLHGDGYGVESGLHYQWSGGAVVLRRTSDEVQVSHYTGTDSLHAPSAGVRWYVHSVIQLVFVDGAYRVDDVKANVVCVP
jgi:hypothetical protein